MKRNKMINKSCIFIDHDPYNQAVFTRALGDVSPETICLTASSAEDAIYMLTKENVMPSYIFVEQDMPDMSGIDFLKTIKQFHALKDIPVIVHSLSPPANKIIEMKESGALAIYYRPYEYWSVCNMLTLYFGSQMATIQPN